MSETETTETATTWVQPGQEVVVIHGRHQMPTPVLTIDRVLKRDVVLSNGDRFRLTNLVRNGEHIQKHGATAWDPSSALFPADHPRVEQARREQSEREGFALIWSLANDIMEAVRGRRFVEAHHAVTALAPLLAERADSGSSPQEGER